MKKHTREFTCKKCGRKNTFDPVTVRSKQNLIEQVQVGRAESLIAYLPQCRSCGQQNEVAPSPQAEGTTTMSKRHTGRKRTARGTDSSSFWGRKSVEELAVEQGVEPVNDPKELRGDFWPPGESTDQFLTWLRNLRQEGERDR